LLNALGRLVTNFMTSWVTHDIYLSLAWFLATVWVLSLDAAPNLRRKIKATSLAVICAAYTSALVRGRSGDIEVVFCAKLARFALVC